MCWKITHIREDPTHCLNGELDRRILRSDQHQTLNSRYLCQCLFIILVAKLKPVSYDSNLNIEKVFISKMEP